MIETNKFYEFLQPKDYRDCKLLYRNNMEVWDKNRFLTITSDDTIHPFTIKTASGKTVVEFKRISARSIDLDKILRTCFIKFTGSFSQIKCVAVNKIWPWKEEDLDMETKV